MTDCLHSLFHPSNQPHLSPSPCHVIRLTTIPSLPYIPLSLTGYWSSHSFLSSCAGWLPLINIDNCLLSLHAKHSVFFSMNPGLSLMQPAGPSLFSFHVGIPPLMTGDNLLSLLIPPPPPNPTIPLLIDYREIWPCVPLSTKVNIEGHVARFEYIHLQIFRWRSVHNKTGMLLFTWTIFPLKKVLLLNECVHVFLCPIPKCQICRLCRMFIHTNHLTWSWGELMNIL